MDAMLAVEMDEVGIRPWNEFKDLDECMTSYFITEKAVDFTVCSADIQLFDHHKKVTTDDEDTAMSSDEYEIDPETGEKIFRPTPSAASISLSPPSSNNEWIEEYLSNIESSSSQIPPATTTSSHHEINFTDLPLSLLEQTVDQTDPDWLATFIDLDESSVSAMFTDPALPTSLFESGEDKSNSLTTTSPIYVPLSNEVLFNGSLDDEYSASGSSSSDGHDLHFYPASQNADRATLVETKLEKLEREDNSIPRAISRRTSARAIVQGQQDEEALHRLRIPLSLDDITMSSTEEYNRHLVRLAHLSAEQIHLVKDIRRRGKNKIAAQNCRKRKAINTDSLSEEVDELKRTKHALEERKRQLQQEIHETRSQYEYLHRQVLPDRQLPPAITVK